MLPASRNTTYTAALPVAGADLNDIQDCIVDAKHPELGHGHGGTWIIPPGNNAVFDDTHSPGGVKMVDATSMARCSLAWIPNGDRIKTIGAAFVSTTANAWILQLRLWEINVLTGAVTEVNNTTFINLAAAFHSFSLEIDQPTNAGCAYFLEIGETQLAHGGHPDIANDCFLVGAIVTTDKL